MQVNLDLNKVPKAVGDLALKLLILASLFAVVVFGISLYIKLVTTDLPQYEAYQKLQLDGSGDKVEVVEQPK